MNTPQGWLLRFGAVHCVDQVIDVWLGVQRPLPRPHPEWLSAVEVGTWAITLYGWWRAMRWIDRRPLEPERRSRTKFLMSMAAVFGTALVLSRLVSQMHQR